MEPKAGASAGILIQDREYNYCALPCRTVPTANEIFDIRTGEQGTERSTGDFFRRKRNPDEGVA